MVVCVIDVGVRQSANRPGSSRQCVGCSVAHLSDQSAEISTDPEDGPHDLGVLVFAAIWDEKRKELPAWRQ